MPPVLNVLAGAGKTSFDEDVLAQRTPGAEFVNADELERARWLGLVVVLYHIHVSTPELAAARVRTRVSAGGHDVTLAKLAARHAHTLALLPRAVLLADRAYVFDNSRLDRSFTHVLTFETGCLRRLGKHMPEWVKAAYGDALRAYLAGRRERA